jgi:hypothetical protein
MPNSEHERNARRDQLSDNANKVEGGPLFQSGAAVDLIVGDLQAALRGRGMTRSLVVAAVIIAAPLVLAGCKNRSAAEGPPNSNEQVVTSSKKASPTKHERFYRQLFAPLEKLIGPIGRDTLVAIIGFDAGGPLNFCTIGKGSGKPFVTYVSCELAVRPEQKPSESGRYELLIACDDERWVRSVLSDVGRMSLDEAFGHHHTLDIGPLVGPDPPIQGLIFEKVCDAVINGERFNVLRCIGITRSEMEFALKTGAQELIRKLKQAGVYPNTATHRASVL